MRTIIEEVTVYPFAELTDRAKERAREWMRRGIDFDVSDLIENTVIPAADRLGIHIATPRGSWTRYAVDWDTNPIGAAFAGSWYASKFRPGEVEKEFPLSDELHALAARFAAIVAKFPDASAACSAGRYCTQRVDADPAPADDCEHDADEACDAIRAAVEDFASWIASTINAEYEYRHSDEAIDEDIAANEYEFTANGEVYP